MFNGRELQVKGQSIADILLPLTSPALWPHPFNPWPFTGHVFSLEVIEPMFERLKAQDGQAVLLAEYKLNYNYFAWARVGLMGLQPELQEGEPACPEGPSQELSPLPSAGPTATGTGQGQALMARALRY